MPTSYDCPTLWFSHILWSSHLLINADILCTLPWNHFWPDFSVTQKVEPKPVNIHIDKSFHAIFKIIDWGPDEKWPILRFLALFGSFLYFWPVFFVFWGVFKYFLDTGHHGGWPRVNLNFCTFFIFYLFGRFLDFCVVFEILASVEIWGFFGSASELHAT